MKVGDTVAVNIGGHNIADAKVTEINDNQAVLVVPATRVVMGIRTELEVAPQVAPTGTEHAILGVENRDTGEIADTPQELSVPSATVTPEAAPDVAVPSTVSAAAPVDNPAAVVTAPVETAVENATEPPVGASAETVVENG